jgi:hypothetical protein
MKLLADNVTILVLPMRVVGVEEKPKETTEVPVNFL